ncbi:MAG: VWA domain-containing protein [Planctomycetota bacterium]|nr:MAG: VWA domain-containing protein [Planctomycetota bacterium]
MNHVASLLVATMSTSIDASLNQSLALLSPTLAMTWVTPVAGAILGASVLAPLIALWFLKLRRKRRVVSSTLLWSRSLADLRANAPFQRLRMSWLLLLQILAVCAIAFALAQPEAEGFGSSGGRHVILIDRSASMNAIEGDATTDASSDASTTSNATEDPTRSRLALAKVAAKARVDELLGGGWFSARASDVMVVTFGARAEIRAPFTDSVATLHSAIDAITPTDEATALAEALELSRAFTTNDRPDETATALREAPPTIELFSDGRLNDLDKLAMREGEDIVYHRVGSASRNLAVAAISAERPPDSQNQIQVFAAVVNPTMVPARATLHLAVDGTVRAMTPAPIEIPAGIELDGEFIAGRTQVVFRPIEQPNNASIEVAIIEDDALRVDDSAVVVVAPAKQLAVLHVGAGGFLVRTLLEGLPIARFASVTLGEYEALIESGTTNTWDVVVLDGVAPKALPSGRYFAIGVVPPIDGLTAFGNHSDVYPRLVRDEHPLFRQAGLDELFVSKSIAVQADRRFQTLADSAQGGLILTLDRSDLHLVLVAFDPLDSNWPFQRSFVNFFANAIDYLGRAGDAVTGRTLTPGDAIAARLPAGSRDGVLTLPDGATTSVTIAPDGSASWGPVLRAGLYRLGYLVAGRDARETLLIAVNITDPAESRIEPRAELDFGTSTVQGVDVAVSRRGALWPWVLALGLLLVLTEWWYYQRQIRLG